MQSTFFCILATTANGLLTASSQGDPAIPKDLEWSLTIDGKDAHLGPRGYDDHGFEQLTSALPFVLDQTAPFSRKLAMQIHDKCCWQQKYRGNLTMPEPMDNTFGWCFVQLPCKFQMEAISDIPPYYLVTKGNQSGCLESILSWRPDQQRLMKELKWMFDEYETDAAKLVQKGASFDAKLDRLARMLRRLAWLHPFSNFNGRFRTLLLQREIRSLGLGAGAAMYNNNRDVFFIGLETYKQKISEGINTLHRSLEKNENAWLEPERVLEHKSQFPAPVQCNLGQSGDVVRQASPEAYSFPFNDIDKLIA